MDDKKKEIIRKYRKKKIGYFFLLALPHILFLADILWTELMFLKILQPVDSPVKYIIKGIVYLYACFSVATYTRIEDREERYYWEYGKGGRPKEYNYWFILLGVFFVGIIYFLVKCIQTERKKKYDIALRFVRTSNK